MKGRRLALALLGLLALRPSPAGAEVVVADLSSHLIAITTGFTGASVVLFGATDGAADVVAIIRGPERDTTIWRKGKIAGIWANTDSVTFANIPSFYAVAASRPLLPPPAAGFTMARNRSVTEVCIPWMRSQSLRETPRPNVPPISRFVPQARFV